MSRKPKIPGRYDPRVFEVDKRGFNILFSAMTGKKRHKFRVHLFTEQNGLCWWCKKKMILVNFGEQTKNTPKQDRINNNHPDVATFEHLQDDWSLPDGKDYTTLNIKLACGACNQGRCESRYRIFNEYLMKEFDGDRIALHKFIRNKKPRDLFPMFVKHRDEIIQLLNGVYFGPVS